MKQGIKDGSKSTHPSPEEENGDTRGEKLKNK